MTDPIFKPGDQVECTGSRGYAFTTGKAYTVLRYEPGGSDGESPFRWPAYVSVLDDDGKRVFCHASRFKHMEASPASTIGDTDENCEDIGIDRSSP